MFGMDEVYRRVRRLLIPDTFSIYLADVLFHACGIFMKKKSSPCIYFSTDAGRIIYRKRFRYLNDRGENGSGININSVGYINIYSTWIFR
jgi:hypothetical protein